MDLDNFLEFKQQIFSEWQGAGDAARRRFSFEAEGRAPEPSYRLGLGFSFTGRGARDVRGELRIQQEGSLAEKEAREISERMMGEARIRVANFEIPAIGDLVAAAEEGGGPGRASLNPVAPGASISVAYGGTGTLGGFVQLADGRTGFLSNNHVIARLGTAKAEAQLGEEEGDRIYQPGRGDKRYRRASDCVGRLYDFIALDEGEANAIDVAVGLYESARATAANMALASMGAPSDLQLGQPKELAELLGEAAGMVVPAKIGRSTGYREGRVSALGLDGVTVNAGARALTFNDVIEIESDIGSPFSQPGDSGSIVFDRDSGTPFGLHFAGGQTKEPGTYVSLSCSLPEALHALDLKWL
ncbi:MAG: hypothetical protein AAFU72_10280 [Pseudomonadota bacterium]